MSFLALEGIAKSYGDFTAVHGTNLGIAEGEFISLLGPSGCGKTTTLQMIAGFIEPSHGRVLLQGRDLTKLEPFRRGLGMVFQSYALFPHMTAEQNVAFGLEMRKIAPAERRRQARDALAMVGLESFMHRYPRQMSGGQQQRVALARAIVIKPPVLLLDEPLSNLDAKLRETMQEELRSLQRSLGTTTVLVTHDQGEAMALSDRIVVMNAGRVEQVGAPEDIYAAPATDFVAQFLGRSNALSGRVEAGRLHIGAASWTLTAPAANGPVSVSVRPEKLQICGPDKPGQLRGTMRRRIFQGAHWLCEIDLPDGPVTVIHPNAGHPCPRDGAPVELAAEARDLTVQPAGAA